MNSNIKSGSEIEKYREELSGYKKVFKNPIFEKIVASLSNGNSEELEEEMDEGELLQNCNEYLGIINDHLLKLHNLLVRIYRKKFPGLEEQIIDPLKFANVAKRIGNANKIDEIDFSDLLPNKSILVLRLTFSNCGGEHLSDEEMGMISELIDFITSLSRNKEHLLGYISSQMHVIVPNLSAIIGTTLAAQLVGEAGGLDDLAQLPSSTILLLGRTKKNLHGMSSGSLQNRFSGIIGLCDIVQSTPAEFQKSAARRVANKAVLAIRADRFNNNGTDVLGKKLRKEIIQKLTKVQEPQQAAQEKPLPIPDSFKRKTPRGGRNARRLKRVYGLTDVRKKMNRVKFGEEQVEDLDTGETYGLLGAQTGSNALTIQPKTKIRIKKQLKKTDGTLTNKSKTPFYGGESGLSSSLNFTPIQGISLTNPAFHKSSSSSSKNDKKRKRYFDDFDFMRPKKKRKTNPK